MIVVRAHHLAPSDDDWRARVLAAAERAARTSAPGSLAAVDRLAGESAGQVVVLVPEAEDEGVRRVAEAIARELQARCTASRSRSATRASRIDPVDLYRAGNEALLAANVAEARPAGIDDPLQVLAFEDTGAYRLLLPAMSEDPAELQRFYAETVAAARRLRRPVRDRPGADARDVPRRATATSPAPPSGSTPTATPSATGSSACAT